MKIYTLRDNTSAHTLGDPITAAVGIYETGKTVWDAISGLFGGGDDPGHYENGVFYPGDLENRKQYVNSKMQQYGLTVQDVDLQELYNLLLGEGIWQTRVDNYIQQAYNYKKTNTTPVNPGAGGMYDPSKYPGGQGDNHSGGLNLAGSLDLNSLLLYGGGAFFAYKLLSSKRRK